MNRMIKNLLKSGPIAVAGTSVLALLGFDDCTDPSTPTPEPPTCYAPVLITPTPKTTPSVDPTAPPPTCYAPALQTPTPKPPSQAETTVTRPTCYEAAMGKGPKKPAPGAQDQVARLVERLAALDKVARMDRLPPDVVRSTVNRIVQDIDAIGASAAVEALEGKERTQVQEMIASAHARATRILAGLAE